MSDDEGSDNGEPQYQVVFEGEDPSKKPDKYLRKDGKAAAKFANDDTYVGEYLNGKRHGQGVYTFASGARYEGQYVNGQRQGQGTFLTLDGGKYSGSWVADKREGEGTYVYANGDAYTGGWVADRKHGRGTYTYAKNGAAITGQWSNGQIMHGTWSTADGSRFVGAWHKNQPSGLGLHVFAHGGQSSGAYVIDRKQGYKWVTQPPALSSPDALPPAPQSADPLRAAMRFIQVALLKSDGFEGIYRLKKEVEGCPNLRRVAGGAAGAAGGGSAAGGGGGGGEPLPIFAMGQPTPRGLVSFASEWAPETQGVEARFIWVNFRSEPVVYVNNQSYTPRSKHALNEPLQPKTGAAAAAGGGHKAQGSAGAGGGSIFGGANTATFTASQLDQLEQSLSSKLKKDVAHRGNLHLYLKDTYAERPEERRHIELSEEVRPAEVDEETGESGGFGTAIATSGEVFAHAVEEGGLEIEYVRLPLPSGHFPPARDVDTLVGLLKSADPSTTLVFNDQMGRGRATLGAIIATLVRRAQEALTTADERAEANPAAGRTDIEGLDLPEFDDADPNLRLGQYSLIIRLVRGLAPPNAPQGWCEQLKAEVDDAIDRCKQMQHVRESILFARDMAEKEAALAASGGGAPISQEERDARQRFWLANARGFVERYAGLLLFHAYVKANVESEFEQQTFAQFVESKQQILDECVGTHEHGPLAEFKWQ